MGHNASEKADEKLSLKNRIWNIAGIESSAMTRLTMKQKFSEVCLEVGRWRVQFLYTKKVPEVMLSSIIIYLLESHLKIENYDQYTKTKMKTSNTAALLPLLLSKAVNWFSKRIKRSTTSLIFFERISKPFTCSEDSNRYGLELLYTY